MSLATRCPWCETVFQISKEQVAVRGGMARCGACARSFNALDHLIEERVLSKMGARSTPIRIIPNSGSGAEEDVDETTLNEGAKAVPGGPAGGANDDYTSYVPPPGTARPPVPHEPPFETRVLPSFLASARQARPKPSAGAQAGWGFLAFLALLGLALQAVYVWRDEVAAEFPEVKPLLILACTSLHCTVGLPRHIESITIESSELQPVQGNKDSVAFAALLRSHAPVSQRYPTIDLSLTDAQDQVQVRKMISPDEYLLAAQRAHELDGIAPNSELPIRVLIEAPGLKIQGYRTSVFYP